MIRIPTTPLAQRALGRILEVAQRVRSQQTTALGTALDQALSTPAAPAAVPDGFDEAIIARALDL